MRSQPNTFFIFKNEKFSVITKAKVASRTMVEILEYHSNPYIYLDINGNSKIFENELCHNIYNEILTNSTDTPLYLLYRNPQKRYYSGIIEDLIRVIDSDTIEQMYYLRKYFINNSINPFKFSDDIQSKNYEILLSDEKYINFLKELIMEWIEWQLMYKVIYTHHTEPYMDTLYNISIKNKNKTIFVNIDDKRNCLENIFVNEKTESTSEILNSHQKDISHKNFYNLVDGIFGENEKYLKLKEDVLQLDNIYYDILEKSNKNILK